MKTMGEKNSALLFLKKFTAAGMRNRPDGPQMWAEAASTGGRIPPENKP
jgi:hypothetical protein